mgnify:FL=1
MGVNLNNIELFYARIRDLKNQSFECLKSSFYSENIRECYSAAKALGKRMTRDSRSRDFIFETLRNKKNLHAIRHAFTALTIYVAYLKSNNKDKEVTLLDSYLNIKESQTIKVSLVDYFEDILLNLESRGMKSYLEDNRKTRINNSVILNKVRIQIKNKVQKLNSIIAKENKKQNPNKQKISGITKNLKHLNKIKLTNITYDVVIKNNLNVINVPKNLDIDDWIISSIIFSLFSLLEAYYRNYDFFFISYFLIKQSEKKICYIKNIPYFLYELEKCSQCTKCKLSSNLINNFSYSIEKIIDNRISNAKINMDFIHLFDFLKDYSDYKNNYSKYSLRKSILHFCKVYSYSFKDIRKFLIDENSEEFKWKSLEQKEKNLILLYQHYFFFFF